MKSTESIGSLLLMIGGVEMEIGLYEFLTLIAVIGGYGEEEIR